MTEKVAARRSSTIVPSVRTQSSPSIGATALTAWAPRNPINKYYNGTPREVGAQHILLLGPTFTLVLSLPRPILASPRVIFLLLLVASRRKKDLSYVALPQPLHSSYTPALGSSSTTSAKLRLPPRRPAPFRTTPLVNVSAPAPVVNRKPPARPPRVSLALYPPFSHPPEARRHQPPPAPSRALEPTTVYILLF